MNDLSFELFERSKHVAPGGVHSPVRAFRNVDATPRFIESASDALLKDVDQKTYLDFCMSWGPLILGHGDAEVRDAAIAAIKRGWSFGAAEQYSLELAELIAREVPWVEKIRFVNSGTEAVMSALRVARAATGRNKILKFSGCYHGHVDGMLVKAGSGLAEMASPDSAGVSQQQAQETIVAELDDAAGLRDIFTEHGKDIAAVIVEPLPANNGLLPQRPEFIDGMMRLAGENGSLVIFDEVISGFRLGFRGAASDFQRKPDLVTYGKVIGGGFPVGAFGGRAELMAFVAPAGDVYQAGTLSANPVAMSAGLATLKKLLRDDPYESLAALTGSLAEKMETAAGRVSDIPVRVQHVGSLFWIAFGERNGDLIRNPQSIPSMQKDTFSKMYPSLLERGVYLAPSGFEVGFMATVHTPEHIETLVEAFGAALKELQTT